MPKRPNPWGESSPLQLKSHIGAKEINFTNCDKMESVYEKTKSLLFQGSKKQFNSCPSTTLDFHFQRDPTMKILPGQMRLDTTGHLCSDLNRNVTSRHHLSPVSMDDNSNSIDMIAETIQLAAPSVKLLPGQMTLNQMAQLQSTASIGNQKKMVAFKSCHLCNHGNPQHLCKCGACERETCVQCLTQCSSCDSFVCKICSRVNYDDFLERSICYKCSD